MGVFVARERLMQSYHSLIPGFDAQNRRFGSRQLCVSFKDARHAAPFQKQYQTTEVKIS